MGSLDRTEEGTGLLKRVYCSPSEGKSPLADVPFSPFSFAVLADLHLTEPGTAGMDKLRRAVSTLQNQSRVDFVLLLGDILWHGSTPELEELLRPLGVPCFVVPGNNDSRHWTEQERQTPFYYSFVHKRCLFVGLNNVTATPDFNDHRGDLDDAQYRWLCSTLESHAAQGLKHTFLFAHIPPLREHVLPSFRMRVDASQRWAYLCGRYGVTACFFGHIHQPERYTVGDTECLTTPSLNWNFQSSDPKDPEFTESGRSGSGAFATVDVTAAAVEYLLHWRRGTKL